MEQLQTIFMVYGLRTLIILAAVVAAYYVSAWLSVKSVSALCRARVDKLIATFLGSVIRWGIMVLTIVGCLGIFGVETTSIAAILGASALAIGLAFQGSLSNLASGVMLLIFRPFKVDDMVVINGQVGKVQSTSLFTTDIDTLDNRRIILPNSSVFGATIENSTHHPIRRVEVTVAVEHAADLDHTRAVLADVAKTLPKKLDNPAPSVALTEMTPAGVTWAVRVWCNTADCADVTEALIRQIKYSIDRAGIRMPRPGMDVNLRNTPAPDR